MNFSDLGLSDLCVAAVDAMGYTKPTPIQESAIPLALRTQDIIGLAQTGTGKTAAFTLPMIDILSSGRSKARMPRGLILSPTRELAAQIAENFRSYSTHTDLTYALLIGGTGIQKQEKALDKRTDVIIATPGRMMDLFERGRILMTDIKMFVIDEADRMLDMGFIPDIAKIAAMLPATRQTMLFSATMPKEIKNLAETFMVMPRTVSVTPPASPAKTVKHSVVYTDKRNKKEALKMCLESDDFVNAFIFCNRKRDISALCSFLKSFEFRVGGLHGDMTQPARNAVLKAFKTGAIDILVCSDVAARGLDISNVSHVFNFDVPFNPDDYIHRIGRTGRAGKTGIAVMLVTADDNRLVAAIEKNIGQKLLKNPASEDRQKFEVESQKPKENKKQKKQKKQTSRKKLGKSEEVNEDQRVDQPKVEAQDIKQQEIKPPKPQQSQREPVEEKDDIDVMGFGSDLPMFMRSSSHL